MAVLWVAVLHLLSQKSHLLVLRSEASICALLAFFLSATATPAFFTTRLLLR